MLFTHHIAGAIDKQERASTLLSELPELLFHFVDDLVDVLDVHVLDVGDVLVADAETVSDVLGRECIILCTWQAVLKGGMHLLSERVVFLVENQSPPCSKIWNTYHLKIEKLAMVLTYLEIVFDQRLCHF